MNLKVPEQEDDNLGRLWNSGKQLQKEIHLKMEKLENQYIQL
jgi:hypothetical protein